MTRASASCALASSATVPRTTCALVHALPGHYYRWANPGWSDAHAAAELHQKTEQYCHPTKRS